MLTEADAKTKWCPFSRVVVQSVDDNEFSPAGNRVQVQRGGKTEVFSPIKTATCLASDCMAWRQWVGGDNPKGFCGLSGQPTTT